MGTSTRLDHPVRMAILQQRCRPWFRLLLANRSAFRKRCQNQYCQNQLSVTGVFPFSVTLVVIKCFILTRKKCEAWMGPAGLAADLWVKSLAVTEKIFKSLIKKPCWFKDLTRNVCIMNYLQMIIQIVPWWFISPSFIKLPFQQSNKGNANWRVVTLQRI